MVNFSRVVTIDFFKDFAKPYVFIVPPLIITIVRKSAVEANSLCKFNLISKLLSPYFNNLITIQRI